MALTIVPVVDGHGEVFESPILFRRLIGEMDLGVEVEIARPIRQPRGSLLKNGGIERAVQLAAIESGYTCAVLVLIDSEGDCPKNLAPILLARAREARADRTISLILAHHE